MNRSLNPTERTVKAGSSGTIHKPLDNILGMMVSAVDASSGFIWDATDPTFRVVSGFPQAEDNEAESELLSNSAIKIQTLNRVNQTDGPVLCYPEPSSGAANAILFGRLPLKAPAIVGLAIPLDRLRKMNLDALKSRFAEMLKSMPTLVDGNQQESPQANRATATKAKLSIGIRELSLYLKTINSSIELSKSAASVANETCRLLNCDRVSVLIKKRGKFCLQAISGQVSINHRSQTTQLLQKVASRILSSQQVFWYPDEPDVPTQISQSLDEYISTSSVRNLVVVPLFAEDREIDHAASQMAIQGPNSVIGGIVFEHYRERWDRTSVEPAVKLLTEHCSSVLRNASQHQKIFLLPLWTALGNCGYLTAPRMLPKLAMVAASLLLVFLTLCFWRVDFYVAASGILVPEQYKPVFAPTEGSVNQILIQHGDHVSKGDTLLTLSSPEHAMRISEVESSLATAQQRLTIVKDQRFKTRSGDQEKVEENVASLKTQIESWETQLAALRKISTLMTVQSPLDGKVVTWDLHRKLENRVVSPGMQLLEVAHVDGKWLLEIDLPIQRLGHVRRALQSRQISDLRVSFMLASDTGRRFSGHMVKIESSVGFNTSNQQVVKVWAAIDDEEIRVDQMRTGVIARIYCDETCLGYQWFHGVGEFFSKNFLFRYL